jgi:hypothetical protein
MDTEEVIAQQECSDLSDELGDIHNELLHIDGRIKQTQNRIIRANLEKKKIELPKKARILQFKQLTLILQICKANPGIAALLLEKVC